MRLTLPVLVGVDDRDRFHVQLATAKSGHFSGHSLTEILDDLALDVMERAPRASPRQLASWIFCHDVSLRRVKIATTLPLPSGKVQWEGRLSVVVVRWRKEPVRLLSLPRLSLDRFPSRGGSLDDAVEAHLVELAEQGVGPSHLAAAKPRRDEHLEVIEVDVELPTVLSTRTPKRRRKTGDSPQKPTPDDKKTWVPPRTLREVGVSLGHRALDGALRPAFGRDSLVERIVNELKRPGACVLLVGPSGVGKTAIIHEVVQRMVDPHASLTERRDFWALDGNRLIAGMSFVGAWERRVEAIVDELVARNDVLVVDDLPTLVYTGRSAQSDTHVAQFLEPHVTRRSLRILAECTAERLAAAHDEAPGFFGAFRTIQVPALDERQSLLVAQRIARSLEEHRPLRVTPDALTSVLGFNRRFQASRCQPGAAVTLLRRVADEARPEEQDIAGRQLVDQPATLAAIQRLTGLPDFVLDPRHARTPDEIRTWFDERVLAQPNAAQVVVDVVCTLQQGLSDPFRPIATLLLVGPTGVGKTETAKALATWLFGDPSRLLRFDMSEFRGPDASARLIGDMRRPDGELTRRVAQQPFSVVLFDEIEKAHPAIFDVLLQVMGEGRLTNAVGHTTDLTSTIVVLTSNLGVAEARRSLGFDEPTPQGEDAHYRRAAEAFFRPEFVNRLDRVVAFRSLQRQHVGALVQRLVEQLLGRRGFRRSGVLVRVDPEVVDFIVDEGFHPAFGARALKRTLETRLTVPLARELVGRRPGELSHVDVFPRGSRLELLITGLERRADWVEPRPVPSDIAGLRALHRELEAGLHALTSSPRWGESTEARRRLLEGDGHSDKEIDAFHNLADLVTLAGHVQSELEELASEHLGSFRFVEAQDYEHYDERGREQARRIPVVYQQPVAVDTERERQTIRQRLTTIRMDLAVLRYRAHQVGSPDDPVVVRILPETPESRAHGLTVARAMASAWVEWGRIEAFRRDTNGWRPANEVDARHSHGEALCSRVPGLRRLLEVVHGYVLDVTIAGPDTVSRLSRLEVLPPSELTPLEQLTLEDRAWEDWRASRIQGSPDAPSPRPVLEVSMYTGVLSDGTSLDGSLSQRIYERGLAVLEGD